MARVYPVRKSANGRSPVGQSNVPYLMVGNSPQALIVNITEAEADRFFADRSAHGDDPVWINLDCATSTCFPTYARLRQDYNRPTFLPSFMAEADDEFESLHGPMTAAPNRFHESCFEPCSWYLLVPGGETGRPGLTFPPTPTRSFL